MDDPLELRVAPLERHDVDQLADHVARDVADDMRAEDLPVLWVSHDLDETRSVVVDDGSSRAAELELADLDLPPGLLGLVLGHSDARHLWMAEGGARNQV